MTITARGNQSMYDLCLMAYGTLDMLVPFCTGNSVTDINAVPAPGTVLNYNPALAVSQSVTGLQLATAL